MSIKNYGIYLSYAPGIDLRHEGLGRYLAAFLKGANGRNDVRFVIVCPSWSREALEELLEHEDVPPEGFEVISPPTSPLILKFYQWLSNRKKRKSRPSLVDRMLNALNKATTGARNYWEQRIIRVHTYSQAALVSVEAAGWALLALTLLIALSPLISLATIMLICHMCYRRILIRLRPLNKRLGKLRQALSAPKNDNFVLQLYTAMDAAESTRMLDIVNSRSDIKAWYCPTAFWPAVNQIKAPKLICVPDLVLVNFPLGFSDMGGDRTLSTFQKINQTIQDGQYFVTYSQHVKNETLVQQFCVPSSNVEVIPHAPNRVDQWLNVTGFADNLIASRSYAKFLLQSAVNDKQPPYTSKFGNSDFKFLFYASQFRPNKNIITLLRAYKHLLRKRLLPHKLILTGNPNHLPEVRDYIAKHELQNDVLCLHGLSIQKLSACYKLADLAVNPSLSEGGCPFTFTEALSVDTPAIMARIPVTEEILTDPELRKETLFDPFDHMALARHIERALEHREELLAFQKEFYKNLIDRTWVNVVDEHVRVLDLISNKVADVQT